MFTHQQMAAMQQHRYGRRYEEGRKRVRDPRSLWELLTATGGRRSNRRKDGLIRRVRSA